MQKLLTFSAKNINVFAIFKDRNFNVTLANNLTLVVTTEGFKHKVTNISSKCFVYFFLFTENCKFVVQKR